MKGAAMRMGSNMNAPHSQAASSDAPVAQNRNRAVASSYFFVVNPFRLDVTNQRSDGLFQDGEVLLQGEPVPVEEGVFGDWLRVVVDSDRISQGETAVSDFRNTLASTACDGSVQVSLVHGVVPKCQGEGNDHRTTTREVIW